MVNRATLALFALLSLSVLASCQKDALEPEAGPFGDLTSRDHTIDNLRLAYELRDLEEIDRLCDGTFTFCYVPGSGIRCFDRDETLTITGDMFGSEGFVLGSEPVDGVKITFTYDPGAISWVSTTPPDPDRYPDTPFYEKTTDYSIDVVAGGEVSAWGSPGRATFVVLVGEIDGRQRWRLFAIADHTGSWGDLLDGVRPAVGE